MEEEELTQIADLRTAGASMPASAVTSVNTQKRVRCPNRDLWHLLRSLFITLNLILFDWFSILLEHFYNLALFPYGSGDVAILICQLPFAMP